MTSDPSKSYGGHAPSVSADPKDRRKSPRYPIIAEARFTDLKTETEFKARVSELSLDGCYLDFLNPVPQGCALKLRIFKDSGVVETDARVVYIHPGMGLGIQFIDTHETQRKILERWIEELKASG
ncbi:MAG TPA: PilZ domain-containing protein [Candidatus Acidoferrales bacterium]